MKMETKVTVVAGTLGELLEEIAECVDKLGGNSLIMEAMDFSTCNDGYGESQTQLVFSVFVDEEDLGGADKKVR